MPEHNKIKLHTSTINEKKHIQIYRLIRTNRHSVGLKITENAELVIHAPKRMPLSAIHSIIEDKRSWIEKNIKRIREKIVDFPKREFKEGEEFLYLGKSFKLKVTDRPLNGPLNKPVKLQFANSCFIANRLAIEKREEAKILFENLYRELAKNELISRAREIANAHQFVYKKLKISNAKKRFGSCSSKGNINLSWRIIMAPQKVIDYVIIHELSHIKHRNHSKEFWKEVEKIMPDYRIAKRWLKNNAHLLKI